jgi:heme-degrading monooxygenase HmoA
VYARLVTGSVAPEDLDACVRLWQETVAPSARAQRGFRGARLMVDRATGQIASMGLWETEAHFQGTVEWNQAQIARFTRLFTSAPTVSGFEVAAEATPDPPT